MFTIPKLAEQLKQKPVDASHVKQVEQFSHDPWPSKLKELLGQFSHKLLELSCWPEVQLVHTPVIESHEEQLESQAIHEVPFAEKVVFEQVEQMSPFG